MRTSIIIRIVGWAILAIILFCILLWGLGSSTFRIMPFQFSRFSDSAFTGKMEGDEGSYSSSNAYDVDAGEIKNIKISWIDGPVVLMPYDGRTISFKESSRFDIHEKNALRYSISGSTLTIRFSEENQIHSVPFKNTSKSLEVLVPRELAQRLGLVSVDVVSSKVSLSGIKCEEINIDSTSGNAKITQAEAQEITMNVTSGQIEVENCTFEDIVADSVSGTIFLQGSFVKVEADTVSGNVTIEDAICPSQMKMDTVSGSCVLRIPENQGFTVKHNSLSGGFHCDFPVSVSKGLATYGDGSASFHVNSVSGSIRIELAD